MKIDEEKKVECCLCDNFYIDCRNGGEELVRHLVDFHKIKHPSRSLFNIFNGTECRYTLMANEESDIVNVIPKTPTNMFVVQRVCIGGSVLPNNKDSSSSNQVKIVNNKCIMCHKSFQSSEEVQHHLLSEHIPQVATSRTSNNRVTSTYNSAHQESLTVHIDPLAIKTEDSEPDVKDVILIDDSEDDEDKINTTVHEEVSQQDTECEVTVSDKSVSEPCDNVPEPSIEIDTDADEEEESRPGEMLAESTDNDTEVEIDEEHFSINNVQVNISEETVEITPISQTSYTSNSEDNTAMDNAAPEDIVIKNELEYEDNFNISQLSEELNPKTPDVSPQTNSIKYFVGTNAPDKTKSNLELDSSVESNNDNSESIVTLAEVNVAQAELPMLQLDQNITSHQNDNNKIKSPRAASLPNLKCEICGKVMSSMLNFSSHMRRFHPDSDQERNKPYNCDICQQGFYFVSSLNSHKSKAHHETSGDE